MSKDKEQVLVVTKDYVGLGPEAILNLRVDNEKVKFLPRNEAEESTDFVQIIPYVVIADENDYFLLTQRRENREQELLGKMTFGVGGHLNYRDYIDSTEIHANKRRFLSESFNTEELYVGDVFEEGISRELWEELRIGEKLLPDTYDLLGTIYKTESPVDRVHLGIVCLFRMVRRDVLKNLPQLKSGRYGSDELEVIDWISEFGLRMLKREGDNNKLESWSQTTLDMLLNRMFKLGDYNPVRGVSGIAEYVRADTYVKAVKLPNGSYATVEIQNLMECYNHSPEVVKKLEGILDIFDTAENWEEYSWVVISQQGPDWTVQLYSDEGFRMNYSPLG